MKKYLIVKIGIYFGIYKNNIVWEEIVYKEDSENLINNDTDYINKLNNSIKKIKLFNLASNSETEIYQNTYKNLEEIVCGTGKVYFIERGSSEIQYIDLETKEKLALCNLPKSGATIKEIVDNKLQYLYYSGNEGKIEKAYYVDLDTKENREFTLLDKNNYLIEILAENNDYYFVRTGYELGEKYTTWAGTVQQDIVNTNYGLIKKENYWNSKAEYINMENT